MFETECSKFLSFYTVKGDKGDKKVEKAKDLKIPGLATGVTFKNYFMADLD